MMIFDIMHATTEEERRNAYAIAQKNYTLILSDGGNWDIFGVNRGGRWALYAIATPNSGAASSYFGDIPHLKNLLFKGYEKAGFLTDAGRIACGIA